MRVALRTQRLRLPGTTISDPAVDLAAGSAVVTVRIGNAAVTTPSLIAEFARPVESASVLKMSWCFSRFRSFSNSVAV